MEDNEYEYTPGNGEILKFSSECSTVCNEVLNRVVDALENYELDIIRHVLNHPQREY